jgi:hypothetical protein
VLKTLCGLSLVLALMFFSGCASTLDDVNKGAEDTGKPVGKVLKVPGSFSKGVSEGIAGEPESNPYDR